MTHPTPSPDRCATRHEKHLTPRQSHRLRRNRTKCNKLSRVVPTTKAAQHARADHRAAPTPSTQRPHRSMFSMHRSVTEIHPCTSKVHRSLPATQRCMCANTCVHRQRLIDNRNPYNDASFANPRAPQRFTADVRRAHRSVPGNTTLHPKPTCVSVGCTTTDPTAAVAVGGNLHLLDAGEHVEAKRRDSAPLAPPIRDLTQPILDR